VVDEMTEPARIVVVEDNPSDFHLLQEALRDAGVCCVLTHFHDGDDAVNQLAAAGNTAPDLIVLDLFLPRTDGLDILAALREQPALAGVPVLVFSSSAYIQDKISSASLGATAYITKPVSLHGYMNDVGPAIRTMLAGQN
jgi:CheY-like chemotaxis protein